MAWKAFSPCFELRCSLEANGGETASQEASFCSLRTRRLACPLLSIVAVPRDFKPGELLHPQLIQTFSSVPSSPYYRTTEKYSLAYIIRSCRTQSCWKNRSSRAGQGRSDEGHLPGRRTPWQPPWPLAAVLAFCSRLGLPHHPRSRLLLHLRRRPSRKEEVSGAGQRRSKAHQREEHSPLCLPTAAPQEPRSSPARAAWGQPRSTRSLQTAAGPAEQGQRAGRRRTGALDSPSRP